jgi:hypothetical protein
MTAAGAAAGLAARKRIEVTMPAISGPVLERSGRPRRTRPMSNVSNPFERVGAEIAIRWV